MPGHCPFISEHMLLKVATRFGKAQSGGIHLHASGLRTRENHVMDEQARLHVNDIMQDIRSHQRSMLGQEADFNTLFWHSQA